MIDMMVVCRVLSRSNETGHVRWPCRLDETRDAGVCVGAAGASGERPIPPALHEEPDGVLHCVRIRRQWRVLDITNRKPEYLWTERDSLPKSALRCDEEGAVHEQLAHFIEDRRCPCLLSELKGIDIYLCGLPCRPLGRLDAAELRDDIYRFLCHYCFGCISHADTNLRLICAKQPT